MKYEKKALTFDQQIELLRNRGLKINDESKATLYLSNISYYRLSAFMLPLKVRGEDRFVDGSTFDHVIDLYSFDRDFRLLIFDGIQEIEVVFRTQLSYHHSLSSGPYWFEDRRNFRDANRWRTQLENIDVEVERSKEVFKDHFFIKYDEHERMPIWMTSEVLSLGILSKLYRNLVMGAEKKMIARKFGIGNPVVLESWMQSITYVRNICAHHSRFWNRILTVRPAYLESPTNLWITDHPSNDKSYYFTCCLIYMLRAIDTDTEFISKFKRLLLSYPDIDRKAIGFPNKWENQSFWA